jgi:hypothetical protein
MNIYLTGLTEEGRRSPVLAALRQTLSVAGAGLMTFNEVARKLEIGEYFRIDRAVVYDPLQENSRTMSSVPSPVEERGPVLPTIRRLYLFGAGKPRPGLHELVVGSMTPNAVRAKVVGFVRHHLDHIVEAQTQDLVDANWATVRRELLIVLLIRDFLYGQCNAPLFWKNIAQPRYWWSRRTEAKQLLEILPVCE